MEHPNPTPRPEPLEAHDEGWVAGITGMTSDSAKTFLDFHSGLRWLHHRDPTD